jgi:hypothetical protein
MKKINTENQLYVELARQGDPSAFYALLHDHIHALYARLRSQGKDHAAARAEAAGTAGNMYRKFLKHPVPNPPKWFAKACKLRKFNAAAAGTAISAADAGDYSKAIYATLSRYYSQRLDRGSDDKGNMLNEHPFLPYVITLTTAVCLTVFLFFSQAVFSVSLERFGIKDYTVSFPKIADDLWIMSGLVRTTDPATNLNTAAPEPASQ